MLFLKAENISLIVVSIYFVLNLTKKLYQCLYILELESVLLASRWPLCIHYAICDYYMTIYDYYMIIYDYYMTIYDYYMTIYDYYMIIYDYYMTIYDYYMIIYDYYMTICEY